MCKLRLIFWHNILSDHQSALMRALAEYPNVTIYFAYEDPAQRGWSMPDFGKANVLDVREPENYTTLTAMTSHQDIHFLSGFFSYPIAWRAFHILRHSQAHICILSEAFNFLGMSGWLRLQRARCQTLIWGNAFAAVLAMGELGTSFYKKAGFPAEKIYEFAYATEIVSPQAYSSITLETTINRPLKALFVGQLIHRKGVDILLRAIAKTNSSNIEINLSIIGEGTLRKHLEALAHQLKISSTVNFLGCFSNSSVIEHMADADVLILPSRWDGWGAVVNEALMVGTSVLCSDRCGASAIVSASGHGGVYPCSSVSDLAKHLVAQAKKTVQKHNLERCRIRAWSHCLSASEVADYLMKIVENIQNTKRSSQLLTPWQLKDK